MKIPNWMQLTILIGVFASSTLIAQGSVLLVGGGSENYSDWSDVPYKWLVEHAPNRKILVLHYADTTTWFSGYFPSLSPCSVSNYFISTTAQANDSSVYRLILQHDGIFLRGGDQAQYVSKWKGTLAQKAIKEVFQRGGVIGGTSAGEMILSSVSYISGNTDNGVLLANAGASITLVDDFLPFVQGALAESHTNERGRIGRLPVFLARYKEQAQKQVMGIAVDVNTAFAINSDGIGEVMGASVVGLYRWTSDTRYSTEAGKQFSLTNMGFDQLSSGFKYNFTTNSITPSSTALSTVVNKVTMPYGHIILEGSNNISDISGASGSLRKLQSVLQWPTDTVAILTSAKSSTLAASIFSTLNTWNVNSKIVYVDDIHKNDPISIADINRSNGYIFAGTAIDSVAALLAPSTGIGNAFRGKVSQGRPVLFVGDDVMLAGSQVIIGLTSSMYSAYYGNLTLSPGLDLLHGVIPIGRFYQNLDNSRGYDYSENRIMGLYWTLAKTNSAMGIIIDAGAFVDVFNNKFSAGSVSNNSTPPIIVDFQNGKLIDYPIFHRPGRPNAVQSAALIGAKLHVLRSNESVTVSVKNSDSHQLKKKLVLEQNFPNPFNPSTQFTYTLTQEGLVHVRIFDTLGKEVAILGDSFKKPGSYSVNWNASGFASGIYCVSVTLQQGVNISSSTMKIVLIK